MVVCSSLVILNIVVLGSCPEDLLAFSDKLVTVVDEGI